jgi:hypothetical protein
VVGHPIQQFFLWKTSGEKSGEKCTYAHINDDKWTGRGGPWNKSQMGVNLRLDKKSILCLKPDTDPANRIKRSAEEVRHLYARGLREFGYMKMSNSIDILDGYDNIEM